MRRFILTALLTGIAFLIVCCLFTNGYAWINKVAETARGKIEMNLPDVPIPKVEINFDKSLLNLFTNSGSNPKLAENKPIDPAEHAEILTGASIQVYGKETKHLKKIMEHYQGILEDEKWEHLVKVKDKFHLSLCYAEEPDIVHGIFLMIIDDERLTFANIYGELDFQKLGILFRHHLESDLELTTSKLLYNSGNTSKPQEWKVRINSEESDDTPKSVMHSSKANTFKPSWLKVRFALTKPSDAPESETETTDRSYNKE